MRKQQTAAILCLVLSLIGIVICAQLSYIHVAMIRGELVGGIGCGGSGSVFNCHVVTGSRYGQLLGMPLSLWGLIGYLAVFALALIASQLTESMLPALAGLTALGLVFVLLDAALLAIMATTLHHFCPLCLATYAINLLLVIVGKVALGQPWPQVGRLAASVFGMLAPRRGSATAWIFWGIVATGAAGVVAFHTGTLYVVRGPAAAFRKQVFDFTKQRPAVQVDTTGDPTMGAANASVRVVEFSDFYCPSCQRAWTFNPILLAGHQQEVAFTFKNFPLDNTCNSAVNRPVHPGACEVAAGAECAHEQGKFWEMHDLIFKAGAAYKASSLEGDAAKLGMDVERFRACMQSGHGLEAVKRDVAEAVRVNVTRTPTYVIGGVVLEGLVSPVMFEELLETLRTNK